jgi:hypothetical protein
MSIVVTCNLSDGLVLGADSAITISGTAQDANGNVSMGVLKVYQNAQKIHPIFDLPVGVLSFGLGYLGNRSIESFVSEFETTTTKDDLEKLSIIDIAEKLRLFFNEKYAEIIVTEFKKQGIEFSKLSNDKKPTLGLVVGGYSKDEYLPEVVSFAVPLTEKRADIQIKRQVGNFGTNWFGVYEGIARFFKGYDVKLINELIAYFVEKKGVDYSGGDKKTINQIMAKHEYQVPYGGMPLKEGIEHVKFLLDLVINQHKFVVGAPVCDAPMHIAVIERGKGLRFIN